MLTHRPRKMRIYPTKEQRAKISSTLNDCRFVYNEMLDRNIKVYERRGEHLNFYAMNKLITEMKSYLPWLKEADSQALQQSCKDLDTAYNRFFKKLDGFPKHHKKRGDQSYRTTNNLRMRVEPKRVKIPCLGWVKSSDRREWPADYHICYETVSRESDGKYYVSITYETEIPDPPELKPNKIIGLDYKSDGLYMDSNGNVCSTDNKYFRKSAKQLAKAQRKLRHKNKKSNNHKKQQEKIAKIHKHIANQRKDFLHKQSTLIAKEYDVVCVEDLDMKAMANKGFGNGKATLDNSYGMFFEFLKYKQEERGHKLIKVDKWFPSSQICSVCGQRHPMPLSERVYRCECGNVMDRDYNAAVNIKNEGMRMLQEIA